MILYFPLFCEIDTRKQCQKQATLSKDQFSGYPKMSEAKM